MTGDYNKLKEPAFKRKNAGPLTQSIRKKKQFISWGVLLKPCLTRVTAGGGWKWLHHVQRCLDTSMLAD